MIIYYLGEIWYDLKLIGEQCLLVKLPLFKSEIGKFCTRDITLENNSDQIAEVKPVLSNSLNYQILPDKIQIAPYSQTIIQIKYQPTNIDVVEAGDILLHSEQIGDWKYEVQGYGLIPNPFEVTKISSYIGSSIQFEIKFKNPFNSQLSLNIDLVNKNEQK